MRRIRIGGVALVLWVVAGPGGPALASQPGDSVRLHPVDGGSWQGRAGLPDTVGDADQALVRVVDGDDAHPEVAAVTGLAGQDTSALARIGFTVAGEEAGIIPCVRVSFTDALGNRAEVMITTRTMRAEPSRTPGWTVYTHDGGLPPGGTIAAVEVGLHVESNPPEPVRVRFDDVVVNDRVFTHAGDGTPGEAA